MGNIENIIITGGAGFIGSHLTDSLLEQGFKIICIDNFDPYYSTSIKIKNLESASIDKNFKLINCDIRDSKELEKCFRGNKIDLIVHLAAKAGIRPSLENPKEYFDVNVMGTLNILEAMRKVNINKMIFASSSSVYGNNTKVPFSETDDVNFPISPYAASKKAGELLCHTYHHLYNFNIYCLRFFTVYGPRQRPDLAIHKFTDLILNNLPIDLYGDGSSSRDYTYISDIIDGITMAINKLNGFGIINLGESKTITLNEMISALEKELNKNALKNYLPMQSGDVVQTCADIDRAKALLGYYPKYEFEKGIKEFIKWKRQ